MIKVWTISTIPCPFLVWETDRFLLSKSWFPLILYWLDIPNEQDKWAHMALAYPKQLWSIDDVKIWISLLTKNWPGLFWLNDMCTVCGSALRLLGHSSNISKMHTDDDDDDDDDGGDDDDDDDGGDDDDDDDANNWLSRPSPTPEVHTKAKCKHDEVDGILPLIISTPVLICSYNEVAVGICNDCCYQLVKNYCLCKLSWSFQVLPQLDSASWAIMFSDFPQEFFRKNLFFGDVLNWHSPGCWISRRPTWRRRGRSGQSCPWHRNLQPHLAVDQKLPSGNLT